MARDKFAIVVSCPEGDHPVPRVFGAQSGGEFVVEVIVGVGKDLEIVALCKAVVPAQAERYRRRDREFRCGILAHCNLSAQIHGSEGYGEVFYLAAEKYVRTHRTEFAVGRERLSDIAQLYAGSEVFAEAHSESGTYHKVLGVEFLRYRLY